MGAATTCSLTTLYYADGVRGVVGVVTTPHLFITAIAVGHWIVLNSFLLNSSSYSLTQPDKNQTALGLNAPVL